MNLKLLSVVLFTAFGCKNIQIENKQEFVKAIAYASDLDAHHENVSFDKHLSFTSIEKITLDKSQVFQQVEGIGLALTGGSAEVIMNIEPNRRKKLIEELFVETNISMLRISIGASDLDPFSFSYLEAPDANFTIHPYHQKYLLPLLKEIKAVRPNITLMASPWSAPAWMKSNNAYIGGELKTEHYDDFAAYIVKYLEVMKSQGMEVSLITVQNEPENPNNEPSMVMTAAQQHRFISTYLGSKIKNNNLTTRILAFDHNCDHPEYPIEVIKDNPYAYGSAFHLYLGDINAMSTTLRQTKKPVYFTEQWTGIKGNYSGDFDWHINNVVIGGLNNHASCILEWNLASDENLQPHTPKGCTECLGALTINTKNKEISRNVMYYIIKQAALYLQPGARRIKSDTLPNFYNVALINPDGSRLSILKNTDDKTRTVKLEDGQFFTFVKIKPRQVLSVKW